MAKSKPSLIVQAGMSLAQYFIRKKKTLYGKEEKERRERYSQQS